MSVHKHSKLKYHKNQVSVNHKAQDKNSIYTKFGEISYFDADSHFDSDKSLIWYVYDY
jgi:hypothetical protein